MAQKSIFIPFFEQKSAETAFRAAAALAKESNGHITAVHIRSRPVPATTVYFPLGGVSTEFTKSFQKAEDQLADDLKALFDKLCAETGAGVVNLEEHKDEHGATASWIESEGDVLMEYAFKATAYDFSILAAAGDDANPMEESIAESLLFESGRPVLLTPASGLSRAPQKVVVAWNGSQEAARAVAASLSLLKGAQTVTVISVRKADDPFINTDEITAYLRFHGVEAARMKVEVQDNENVTARLDQEVRQEQPDLLVMGAYSHSRWREAVLGGFTRHMIHEAKMPVFMMR